MNFRRIKSWQWALLVLALLVALDWASRRPDGRTRELNNVIQTQGSCLVPRCAGVIYSQLRRDDLWDRYYTDAPAQQRRCVERYNIVKRA